MSKLNRVFSFDSFGITFGFDKFGFCQSRVLTFSFLTYSASFVPDRHTCFRFKVSDIHYFTMLTLAVEFAHKLLLLARQVRVLEVRFNGNALNDGSRFDVRRNLGVIRETLVRSRTAHLGCQSEGP